MEFNGKKYPNEFTSDDRSISIILIIFDGSNAPDANIIIILVLGLFSIIQIESINDLSFFEAIDDEWFDH